MWISYITLSWNVTIVYINIGIGCIYYTIYINFFSSMPNIYLKLTKEGQEENRILKIVIV